MIIRSALRAAASTTALVAIYYLLPLNTSVTWTAITILVIGLTALIVLVAFQVRQILTSPFPGLRAVEALATSVPLFLLLFASTYVVMAKISGSNFSEPLTRTDALYFTVTVFSTVGFGDITAKTQAARLVVTAQMITDLVILGVAIKVVVGAVQQRRSAKQLPGCPTQIPAGFIRICCAGSLRILAGRAARAGPGVRWSAAAT